jgi:hypothetical protein
MASKKTVRLTIDIPREQHAYIQMLADKEGLTLEEVVLQCLPHPEGMATDFADQKRQAEEIMNRNREVLQKLSK